MTGRVGSARMGSAGAPRILPPMAVCEIEHGEKRAGGMGHRLVVFVGSPDTVHSVLRCGGSGAGGEAGAMGAGVSG